MELDEAVVCAQTDFVSTRVQFVLQILLHLLCRLNRDQFLYLHFDFLHQLVLDAFVAAIVHRGCLWRVL